ncbi:MAG: methyl-accepting chemotaxis protein [Nitrospirae bacterium]|nr:methyl-accepting chemotaxis protein [Nitrospirota bacterium]
MFLKAKRFKDWPFYGKITSISAVTLVIIGSSLLFYFIPLMERSIMDEKRAALRNLTNVIFSLVAEFDKRVKDGEFSLEDAQKLAMRRVSQIRYGNNDYFWINDLQPRMIMHPIKPELDGKELGDIKDPNGKKLFVEFVEVAKASGEGFVDYMWPKPGSTGPQPKLSYVKLFQPWGWIIGTGIYVDDVHSQLTRLKLEISVVAVLLGLLIIGFSYYISQLITRPLIHGVDVMKIIAAGDLSVNIEVDRTDEAGHLLAGIKDMTSKLKAIISTIKLSSDSVASESANLSASSEQMSKGVSEQSARASQIAAASTEMSQTVVDVAQNTSRIALSATETLKFANNSKEIFATAANNSTEMATSVNNLSGDIMALGEHSNQIGEIIKVIKEIADQTNLLALNAAIEAARAGEQGRGFAVVADEVRKLAEKTSKATSEIGGMIGTMQSQVEKAVTAIGETTGKVVEGAEKTAKAGDALDGVVDNMGQLQSMVQQIASAAEEMSTVSDTISCDIETVANVSVETSESSAHVARTAADLARLSSELKGIVSQFKV